MSMANPPHPGETVKYECLEPLGLSIVEAAEGLGISSEDLSDLINERTGVTLDIAVRLSKAFGSSPETWLGMQMDYDLWQARQWIEELGVRRFG